MLLSLALIIIIGFSLGSILKKIKMPPFVGMIITGMLLGSHGLNVIDGKIMEVSGDLKEIALIIILVRAGLSLDIKELKSVGRPALLLCFIPSVFEFFGVLILAPLLLKINLIEAAIMGTVLSAVSLAVVVPEMIKLIEEGYGTEKKIPQMIMAGASIDNVFIVVMFSVFMGVWEGSGVGVMTFLSIPISIVLGILLGYIAGSVLSKVFEMIYIRDTMKILLILSVAFLIMEMETALKGIIPISGLIAVMFVGISFLRRSEEVGERISGRLSKIWVLAEIVLFVLVGAAVDVKFLTGAGIAAVFLIVLELLFRTAGVLLSLVGSNFNRKERVFCGIAYIPKATVQAAIAAVPLNKGVGAGNIILSVAVLIIFITSPLGSAGINLTYKKFLKNK